MGRGLGRLDDLAGASHRWVEHPGSSVGRPMPNPGIAALPQASVGLPTRSPAARASRDVIGDVAIDVAAGPVDLDASLDVRPGQRLADDRDGLAGLEARLAVALGSLAPPRPHADGAPRSSSGLGHRVVTAP